MFRAPTLLIIFVSLVATVIKAQSSKPDTGELHPLPKGVLLIKGATPAASDARMPLPERGTITATTYQNRYFGLTYPLPPAWRQKYEGPFPSDSGAYVLTELQPSADFKGPAGASILITAQDSFFALNPAAGPMALMKTSSDHLPSYYQMERAPEAVIIAGHQFVRFDYTSPVAGLHWYVLATQIRCHILQFVFSSRDPALLAQLIQQMNHVQISEAADGVSSPRCVPNYARDGNVISRLDPVLPNPFNRIPVRIIIGKSGKVQHVHVISALPGQAQVIMDALFQWRFKPFLENGRPVEIETGISLGSTPPRSPQQATSAPTPVTNQQE